MPVVECPECGERFEVVVEIEEDDAGSGARIADSNATSDDQTISSTHDVGQLDARLLSWNEEDPRHPYSAEVTWSDERINDVIDRLQAVIEIDGESQRFEYFAKPPSNDEFFWTYVVRAETDAGSKSKNVLVTDEDDLYVKNRGVPWTIGKEWTYLGEDELMRRSQIAGLGEVISLPDTDGGLGLLLDEEARPLLTDQGVDPELLTTLAKTLLVFQSETNPTQ